MTNLSSPNGPPSRGEIVLYTRRGCHLCEQAESLLAEFGLRPTRVDVDRSPELAERFGQCVPVVEIDGRVRFRGRVDRVLLRRWLQAPANAKPESQE